MLTLSRSSRLWAPAQEQESYQAGKSNGEHPVRALTIGLRLRTPAPRLFIERFYCSEKPQWLRRRVLVQGIQCDRQCQFQQLLAAGTRHGCHGEYYNRIKATDAEEKARIEGYFQKWYDKRGNNYEGNQNWRGSTGFGNDFTDDTCWIIIALFQMYGATGNQTY